MAEPYVQDSDLTIWLGDAREVLPTLPSESVDCVATSPPFFALRDYNVEGQIGLENSPEEWCAELVAVFRECRRVLSSTGTLWIECGDGYAQYDGQGNKDDPREPGMHGAFNVSPRLSDTAEVRSSRHSLPSGYKRKDLIGSPWLLAFALRADGWWLRQCVIWAKPNAMPESATDRCTTAHSYVFLLSKSSRYFFDADAIAEPAVWERWGDQTVPKHEGTPTAAGWIGPKTKSELRAATNGASWDSGGLEHGKSTWPDGRKTGSDTGNGMKNARSVWTIPTRGYPGAHFATWPMALAERIITAGCPKGGTVLDPFFGAGTTAVAARRLGRSCVGIELNAEYARMAADRCANWWKEPTRTDADQEAPQLSLLAEDPAA